MPLARGQKFLFGCFAVFGVVVLLFLAAGALFVHWIKTPGVPLEGSRLLDPGTAVYLEVRLRPEDPGARGFVRAFLNASRHPQIAEDPNVPSPVTWILGGMPRRDASDAEVDKILPVVVVARREEGEGGAAGPPLLAVSFSPAGNSFRLVHSVFRFLAWRGTNIKKEVHAGEDLFEVEAREKDKDVPVWVSFVGTNLLLARDPDPVRRALDTLAEARSPGTATPPSSLLADRPADSFLYLATKPGYGEAAVEMVDVVSTAIAETLRPLVKGGAGLALWGSLRSADVVEGELSVKAAEGRGAAADLSGSVTLMIGKSPLDVSFEPLPPKPGASQAWKFRLGGLEALARRRLDPREIKMNVEQPRR
jgi:hypothetical protein